MLMIRFNRSVCPTVCKLQRCFSTKTSAASNEEYSDVAEYPAILDTSFKAKKFRERGLWHDAIKNVKTVEEKLIKINMPRYYGYQTTLLQDKLHPYNCLPLVQHYTRTHFEEVPSLPHNSKNESSVKSQVECIKSAIQESLEFAVEYFNQKCGSNPDITTQEKNRYFGAIVVEQINRTLLTSLSADYPHLSEVELDVDPRHEAFWFVGGVNPTKLVKKIRAGVKWQKDMVNDPIDRPVQYLGKPYLAIRHRSPLEAFQEYQDSPEEHRSKLPLFKYDARSLGYKTIHRHGTNLPGFWPGSPTEFGLISYQPRVPILDRTPTPEDEQETLHVQGIQSSYAWLLGQACYQGFSTYNDLTYPLSTQTVITDGKLWSFYVYQMNTTLVHADAIENNPKVNYCWGTKEMKLFDDVNENGKCSGLNDHVLEHLVNFYMNAPVARDINMKPYLGKEQIVANIEDPERRKFLERTFKHLFSNRPRHISEPEIHIWEKLYKIDNKTRPIEARRRFFELGVNPYKRRLDEHFTGYIPKVVRPGGPKSRHKFNKTYYP